MNKSKVVRFAMCFFMLLGLMIIGFSIILGLMLTAQHISPILALFFGMILFCVVCAWIDTVN